MKYFLLPAFILITSTAFAYEIDDLNRQMQLDELQWQLDETKRAADQAADESRKVQKELKDQECQRNRKPVDIYNLPPVTVKGRIWEARRKRETDALAQAQREADQANAQWQQRQEPAATQEQKKAEIPAHVEHSKSVAIKRYPQLQDMDSEMINLMIKIDDHWKDVDHPLYHSLDKPLILAEMAALKLKVAPVKP